MLLPSGSVTFQEFLYKLIIGGWFLPEAKTPNFYQLGVFGEKCVKEPIWAFFPKISILMSDELCQMQCRDDQDSFWCVLSENLNTGRATCTDTCIHQRSQNLRHLDPSMGDPQIELHG